MFAAGMIGGREKKSAMETVKMSFGSKGSLLFAALNVLQLVGWTAIMIYDGALAANGILKTGAWVAMLALFVLTLVLFKVIFFGANGAEALVSGDLTFGAAVELAVAMPLSWLPLISDYTREAEKPFAATLSSVIVYSIVSVFMYMIGMGYHNLPGCLFCRRICSLYFQEDSGEVGSRGRYHYWNNCSDCLSDG